MILQQLTVRNFCLFFGEQIFNLAPATRNGKHLPIVLFGGINGGGKTTLLDAIQLALYGQRARCSKRANLSYDDFLRECIHHGLEEREPAAVALSFRYATEGTERLYDLCRTWRVTDGRVREDLRLLQDGLPDQWLSENWPQMVEELFPLEISQLFFFDAEKIRSLAEDETSSKALGAAIKSLLGLDIVERLITDSTVLQTRLASKAAAPQQKVEIEQSESAVRANQAKLDAIIAERAALENRRLKAEAEAQAAEHAFAAKGGRHWDAREARSKQLGELESQDREIRNQLIVLASGELPLLLVSDLLVCVREQDGREQQTADAELIGQLLAQRDEALIEVLRAARATPTLLKKATEHLANDRQARQPANLVARRLGLNDESRMVLQQLLGPRSTELLAEAAQLLQRLERVAQRRENVERAKAATPEQADIAAISERFKSATQAFTLLDEQARQLDMAIEAQRVVLKDCEGQLAKLLHGKMETAFAHEDAQRMLELAGRTRQTMQVFLQRVTERKIDRLSLLITECFRFLLRKQTLVEQIHIEPASFGITLWASGGQVLARQRLSEGEKQIFAIAVLWGLARASARPLPAVIDTPMARLDAAHRQNLIERYFPNASHQVVIFSTDTEVDRQNYLALQPHIARAYHLNYDEQERRTVGEEGYFWKE
jgi:DNA sulfur modification protein DndD